MTTKLQPRQPRPGVKPMSLLRSLFEPHLFDKSLNRKSIASKLNVAYSTLSDHIQGTKNPSFERSLEYAACAADEGNIIPALLACGKSHTVIPSIEKFFLNGSVDDEIADCVKFLGRAKEHFDKGEIELASKCLNDGFKAQMAMQQELLKKAARKAQ